ncbi:unnamed protein product [Staurois parvus]|uniref:Uncharacterized protein n=1 Tax=Staurois parvus TaxID=386267 RepID=A0ABN9AFV8_9NEOB|nr:unnamed protein product [Staurois parvus]
MPRAHQCHINATYQCLPVHISAHLSCLSVHHQCQSVLSMQSVPPISASQCRLSVRISATYQCQ